jgi:glutathione S-transferase
VARSGQPVLWQIAISHYSEKVRWALAYKGIEHRRRSPAPGAHMVYALWLTR